MTDIRQLHDQSGNIFYPRTHVQAVSGLSMATADADGLMSAEDYVKLSQLQVDESGNITITIPLATAEKDGLMTKEDFAKLSRILFSGAGTVDLQTQVLDVLNNVISQLQNHENRIKSLEGGTV